MGLSQGMVRAAADGVFPKYGLPVYCVTPAGTSSICPACGEKLWAPRYGTKSWKSWRRTKACVPCLYYVNRDSVPPSTSYGAACPHMNRRPVRDSLPTVSVGRWPGIGSSAPRSSSVCCWALPWYGSRTPAKGGGPKGARTTSHAIWRGRATLGRPPGCIQ